MDQSRKFQKFYLHLPTKINREPVQIILSKLWMGSTKKENGLKENFFIYFKNNKKIEF